MSFRANGGASQNLSCKREDDVLGDDAGRVFAMQDPNLSESRLKEPPLTANAPAHWRRWKPGAR